MTAQRCIVLGDGTRVSMRAYLRSVHLAKANPSRRFDRGLTCWWPCTGAEIVQQYEEGKAARRRQRAEARS